MNKYFKTFILAIITGIIMSKIIFNQYNTKIVSNNLSKAYFFEVGVFDDIKSLTNSMSEYNSYIYIKQNNKYYSYIGITLDNYEKVQSYFDNLGYMTKVRELNIKDTFKSRLKEYDIKLKNTDNTLDIKNILSDILKCFEEVSHDKD